MTESRLPAVARDASGRFAPGGAGRPVGSRNRVSARVAQAILADFEAHQDELLPRLRRWFLPQYIQLIARLLPRQLEVGPLAPEALEAGEMARLIEDARSALARLEAGDGSLAELEAAVMGQGGRDADNIGDYR
jgi:hypothetical protein